MATQTVIIKIEDKAIRTEIEKLISAIPGYTIELDDTVTCDLLIFEITDKNSEEQFDFIREAMSSGRTGTVFLVSNVIDPNILIQALRVGAKEFFQLPLNHEDVKNALLKFQTVRSAEDGRTKRSTRQRRYNHPHCRQ